MLFVFSLNLGAIAVAPFFMENKFVRDYDYLHQTFH